MLQEMRVPQADVQKPFTVQDAQNLIALAQNAPLQNLHQAREVDRLCLRAQIFFAEAFVKSGQIPVNLPPAPAPETSE